jgi:hypothetical protein
LQVLLLSLLSKKDAVVDKVPKQPTTHTGTHTQSNKSSITIQAMTNATLLQLRKRCQTETRTRLKASIGSSSPVPTLDDKMVQVS